MVTNSVFHRLKACFRLQCFLLTGNQNLVEMGGNADFFTRIFSAFQVSTQRGIFEGVSTRARRRRLMRAELEASS